jgi:hypothetical protein
LCYYKIKKKFMYFDHVGFLAHFILRRLKRAVASMLPSYNHNSRA